MKTLLISMIAGLALCACSSNTKTETVDSVVSNDTVEVVDSVSDTTPMCECDE